MGRHVDASGTPLDLPRTAQISGLVGGVGWVLATLLPDGNGLASLLLRGGSTLLTVSLFGLGLMLVKSDFLALRLFVAVAVPTLVWGVFALVHGSAISSELLDATFGAAVGCCAGVPLLRTRSSDRATL